MPRINRRRRVQKQSLTAELREVLLHGVLFGKPRLIRLDDDIDSPLPDTATMAELKSLWIRHRAELMTEPIGLGFRPWAFYRFDLRIERPPYFWFDQLSVLLDRVLIDANEAGMIDCGDIPELRPDQSPAYCGGFESADRIHKMRLGSQVLLHVSAEFQTAARWHLWRGRPELAARWAQRTEVVRQVVSLSAESAQRLL